jgi:hypothetical protein
MTVILVRTETLLLRIPSILNKLQGKTRYSQTKTVPCQRQSAIKVKILLYTTSNANQIYIHGEIKSRLKSQNVCYHSVLNLWSSSHLKERT